MDSPGLDRVLTRLAEAVPFGHVRRTSSLTATLDLADNLFLGIEPRRRVWGLPGIVDRRALRAEATTLLRRVDVDAPVPTLAADLDPASRLLVEVARALAHGATVLAVHEPAAGLTDAAADRVARVLRGLADDGLVVVVASQRPTFAFEFGDAVSALVGDSIVPCTRPGETTPDARELLLRTMAGAGSVSGAAGPGAPAAHRPDATAANPSPAVSDAAASGPAFEVVNWSTNDEFERARPTVVNASLTVAAGEVVGLAGLDGSGRNELLLSVFGRTAGTEPGGAVLLDGLPVDTSTPQAAIGNGIFMITTVQPKYRVKIVGGISAPASNTMLPALIRAGVVSRDDEGGVATPAGRALDAARLRGRDDEWTRIRSLLELFPESAHRVLLLVEPTRELTQERREEVWRLVAGIRQVGKSVVVSSASIDELLAIGDRIVAMADGRVVAELPATAATPLEVLRRVAIH
ncbi:hypothetical protein [Agreia sp. COWG]|uniref:hypothetical protein n=1 Tax=Agreia sp. COWG TaxID=2773266 RepID=UPI001AFAC54C|nr:hypothetical protein [Agreia sp. COWG]CAD5991317.1 putative enzyme [Agreia sp. COWG]